MSKRMRTIFSASPRHLLDSVEALTLKKVVLHSLATAFASIVFPVVCDYEYECTRSKQWKDVLVRVIKVEICVPKCISYRNVT